MGFHTNLYMFKGQKPSKEIDFPDPPNRQQLMYWSKNTGLHDWMRQLYIKKKGDQAEQVKKDQLYGYTSQNLLLTTQDLLKLISDIDNGWFKNDLSSFFKSIFEKNGKSSGWFQHENQDRNIFLKALEKQKEGYLIYYKGDGI